MREIKFRAWDDGVMIYHDKVQHILCDNYKHLEQFFKNIREDAVIMQFTGLLDKNGKEIYEGDIVKFAIKKRFCNNTECEEQHDLGSTKFCPSCGLKVEYSDFVMTSEVTHDKGAFQFEYKDGDKSISWKTYFNEIYIEWKEVIGNIHEHPNLLTGGHD